MASLVSALAQSGIFKTYGRRMCQEKDGRVQAFLSRPLPITGHAHVSSEAVKSAVQPAVQLAVQLAEQSVVQHGISAFGPAVLIYFKQRFPGFSGVSLDFMSRQETLRSTPPGARAGSTGTLNKS